MVCLNITIPIDQNISMAKSLNSADPCLKLKQINQLHKSNKKMTNQLNIPGCDQSTSAIVDVIILIAVVCASGVLLYPGLIALATKIFQLSKEMIDVVTEEIIRAPVVFGCLGLSILFAVTALVAITVYTERRCGKPGCRGLKKAAEFDIQLETEDCLKKSDSVTKNGLRKGMFELPRDYHRELAQELKKMAPINGRAILVFKARCGCSVGRLEVPGQKKSRKVKN